MTTQLNFDKVQLFALFSGLVLIFMLMVIPAQAGISLHFGYSPYGGHHSYGHYGYGYGYPRHYGYSSHYYGRRHAYGNRYSYITPEPVYRNRDYDRGGNMINNSGSYQGWLLLSNNQSQAALNDFSRQAQAEPSKGDPKVGFALASADLGQLDKATWAMRRALRTDPDALHYVVLDQKLDAKVKYIIHQYDEKLAYSSRDTDAAFMLASLHYLRRDMDTARSKINQGDISTSSKNLRVLINKER